MLFKKKAEETGTSLKKNAPTVAFWVASVMLVVFEVRVIDVVYTLTKSPLLAGSSLFATGFMFFIWKNSFQYTLADSKQVTMASVGMAISLLASSVFGGMDFFVKGGLVVDTGADKFGPVELLSWGIPILSVIHVVMLLLYWYLDPVVSAERKKQVADDDAKFAQEEMSHADSLLTTRMTLIGTFTGIAQRFGKQAALDQLDALGIDRSAFLGVEVPDYVPPALPANIGHGSLEKPTPPPSMTVHDQAPLGHGQGLGGHGSLEPAMTIQPVPVPVGVSPNGNGHKPNPT